MVDKPKKTQQLSEAQFRRIVRSMVRKTIKEKIAKKNKTAALKEASLSKKKTSMTLFRSKKGFRFCKASPVTGIIKYTSHEDRVQIARGDHLLFVQYHDLTEKTVAFAPEVDSATAAAVGAAAVGDAEVWRKALKEWKKNGKIPGGIFLTPNGKTVWVSHYMFKHLKKIS